jgi:hypothetical protein
MNALKRILICAVLSTLEAIGFALFLMLSWAWGAFLEFATHQGGRYLPVPSEEPIFLTLFGAFMLLGFSAAVSVAIALNWKLTGLKNK